MLNRRPGPHPRLAAAGGALVLLLGMGTLLLGCSGQSLSLAATVSPDQKGDIQPGDTPVFIVHVTNLGHTTATGVNVRVNLPADFRYRSTTSVTGDGQARTQAADAAVNSQEPVWGVFSLGAPGANADGTIRRAHVDITFVAVAAGRPGDYTLSPEVSADATDGLVTGPALGIHLIPSTSLSLTLAALQPSVMPGGTVDYRLNITNDGSGPASSVGILLTLPPTFQFESTEGMQGNSGRSNPIDPAHGALLPFYGGFTIPARSKQGPGLLSIVFRAHCVLAATGGTFGTAVQLTDETGTIVTLDNAAPVAVNAPVYTPPPPAPPAPSPTSGKPGARPTPRH